MGDEGGRKGCEVSGTNPGPQVVSACERRECREVRPQHELLLGDNSYKTCLLYHPQSVLLYQFIYTCLERSDKHKVAVKKRE